MRMKVQRNLSDAPIIDAWREQAITRATALLKHSGAGEVDEMRVLQTAITNTEKKLEETTYGPHQSYYRGVLRDLRQKRRDLRGRSGLIPNFS